MTRSYKQLDILERQRIYFLRKQGFSLRKIAEDLSRSPSTILREIKRNSGGRGYRFAQAQRKARQRGTAASSVPRKMTERMWSIVENKLGLQWSPDQISGRLKLDAVVSVSAEWIYRHVWEEKRNSRGSRYSGRGHIPGRVDITERPRIVEDKRRVGDWEADTIVGAGHRGALVSVVDRASKFTVLHPVSSRSAGEVGEAMMERLMPYVEIVHTITSDNGKEFTGHGEITEALGAGFFFATPYHSWERGLCEHTNGLVRQYFAKGTDFREVRGDDVRRVEGLINGRPRKVLEYRTPEEVFKEALALGG